MRKIFFSLLFLLAAFFISSTAYGSPDQRPYAQEEVFVPGEVALTSIGLEPFSTLQGPFDQVGMKFQLPADWQLIEESLLILNIANSFSSFLPAQGEVSEEGLIAGNLTISLDGIVIHREILQDNGFQEIALSLPSIAFSTNLLNAEHELTIRWDASASCNFNLSTSIIILPESKLVFSFENQAYSPDLSLLPYPFVIQNAIEDFGTVIVIPDQSSENQVAAGIAVASALGRLSKSDADIQMLPEQLITQDMQADNHFIFVGKNEDFSSIQDLQLPHKNSELIKQSESNGQNLGFIELVNSPWNSGRALMLVSGSSEQGVMNAAIRAGSGQLILSEERNLALVEEGVVQGNLQRDTTESSFSQLAANDITFSHFGTSVFELSFYLAPERKISSESFLDLRIAHAELIDYLRSGLTVKVNDLPIGSMRFSDQSSLKHSEIMRLPPSALKPGFNRLEVSVELFPPDICSSDASGKSWLSIFSDSTLNLPDAPDQNSESVTRLDFGTFPMPFIEQNMANTNILLARERPEALNSLAKFFFRLGANYQTWPLIPEIFFIEQGGLNLSEGADHILIGYFDDFLSTTTTQEQLAVSLNDSGGGVIELSNGPSIIFENTFDLGYLEIVSSNAAGDQILAILGNSEGDIGQALSTLFSPTFAVSQKGQSLVIIQNGRLIADNRLQLGALQLNGEQTESDQLLGEDGLPEISTGKSPWLLPMLIFFIIALVAFGTLQVIAVARRNRQVE